MVATIITGRGDALHVMLPCMSGVGKSGALLAHLSAELHARGRAGRLVRPSSLSGARHRGQPLASGLDLSDATRTAQISGRRWTTQRYPRVSGPIGLVRKTPSSKLDSTRSSARSARRGSRLIDSLGRTPVEWLCSPLVEPGGGIPGSSHARPRSCPLTAGPTNVVGVLCLGPCSDGPIEQPCDGSNESARALRNDELTHKMNGGYSAYWKHNRGITRVHPCIAKLFGRVSATRFGVVCDGSCGHLADAQSAVYSERRCVYMGAPPSEGLVERRIDMGRDHRYG